MFDLNKINEISELLSNFNENDINLEGVDDIVKKVSNIGIKSALDASISKPVTNRGNL